MPLSPGARLGPYEVLEPLGAGGMGEVYKARDIRLDRVVAIKIVSSLLAGAPELRQRFDREAKAISQLNHPNICALYDIGHEAGTDYLVLEYVEGETLASRIARGAIPAPEAITVAIQIADALDRAHKQGVIHRDLKPANVMLTRSGAKLLDFGLAKTTVAPHAISSDVLSPATMTTPMTTRGTILGTFQYMSPEQIEGAEADARTDIWAFGCVLYEMLTGRRAFEGKSHASLIGAILKDQPPAVTSTQPLTPPALEQIVRRCFAKEPDDRWQTSRDLVLQLKWVQEGPAAGAPVAAARRLRSREWLAWAMATVSTLVAVAALLYHRATLPAPPTPVSFTFGPPEGATFGTQVVAPFPAISPDGRYIAFAASPSGSSSRLWVRALQSAEPRELAGTEAGAFPFWSPDSRYLAFFAGNKLKKIDVSGGPAQTLADVSQPEPGDWNKAGVILFIRNRGEGIVSVSAAGGQPKPIVTTQMTRGATFGSPSFLPDGRRFVFVNQGTVFVASLDGETPRRLFPSSSRPQYVAPGYILFIRGQALLAQPFDSGRAEVTGEAFPVTSNVRVGQNARAAFSASQNGALVFRGGALSALDAQLVWYSPLGRELGTIGVPGVFGDLVISPDGRRVAFQKHDGDNADIWVLDIDRDTATRVTFDPGIDTHPVWSPDGRALIFGSSREASGIYRKAASGVGNEELVLRTPIDARPHSWGADGTLLFDTAGDVWIGRVGALDSARPLMANIAFSEAQARLSPGGGHLAYQSTESGRGEIYVVSFPDLGEKWMVSTEGGTSPVWNPDGKRLYYLTPQTGATPSLMSVDVHQNGRQLRFTKPARVVTLPTLRGNLDPYALAPDGRILIARPGRPEPSVPAAEPVTVLLNWPQIVERR